MIRKALKFTALGLIGAITAASVYVRLAPPDLFLVGTNYSAKMVCSNVFVAGRDAQEVLAVDVQAPGHPLLTQVSVSVDSSAQTVTAHMFGIFAKATSHYRPGLGCTNLHDADLPAGQVTPLPAGDADRPWPLGAQVALSQDPDVSAVLQDKALLGEGYRAVVVVKGGRLVAETYAPGFDAQTPLLGWSMTKTVTAALIGTLIKSGELSLTDTPASSFPGWTEDARARITTQDMLAMSSGLQWNEGYGNVSDVTRMLYLVDDMAGFAASLPAETAPQQSFTYSSGTSTMLSRYWQDALGAQSLNYPNTALFAPLGMRSAIMETDGTNTFVGSSYMYATARDWARFGQFLLQDGTWEGERLLPEGFADWMAEPVPVSEGLYTKGHMWREAPGDQPPFEDAVWLRGHDGQSVGIFPAHDMVVVRLGLTPSRLDYGSLPLAQALIAALGE